MRVRISFDALRLCLLVAAGVTSGYLWRAAFESSAPDERLAATPRIVEKAPAPKTVQIQPRHLTRPSRPAVAHRVVKRTVTRQVRRAPVTLISTPVAAAPKQPAPKPSLPPEPAPTSTKPTPAPAPPPTTTTTPTQTTTPVGAAAPPQAAAAAAPATPTVSEADKPGWGKGDKNHDHTGPGNDKP
jgi:hypothetical protein